MNDRKSNQSINQSIKKTFYIMKNYNIKKRLNKWLSEWINNKNKNNISICMCQWMKEWMNKNIWMNEDR